MHNRQVDRVAGGCSDENSASRRASHMVENGTFADTVSRLVIPRISPQACSSSDSASLAAGRRRAPASVT
jgi:hypothetical protein